MKLLYFCLFIGLGMVACKHSHEHADTKSTTEASAESGPEYASAFVCPMHCKGSGSDAAGTCPVCNMAYVANEDHKGDGHNHDEDGDGNNHDEGDGHDHDDDDGHNH